MRKIFECEILVLDVGRAAVDVLQKLLWQHWWYLHGERVRVCVDTCRFFSSISLPPLRSGSPGRFRKIKIIPRIPKRERERERGARASRKAENVRAHDARQVTCDTKNKDRSRHKSTNEPLHTMQRSCFRLCLLSQNQTESRFQEEQVRWLHILRSLVNALCSCVPASARRHKHGGIAHTWSRRITSMPRSIG